MRFLVIAATCGLLAAGCGGSKSGSSPSGGSSSAGGSSKLVAQVSDAKVDEGATGVDATAKIEVGGVAGRHLTLQWGLVDALLGNESQTERVVRRYVTTSDTVTTTAHVHVAKSLVNAPLLVHFVLYGPDGRYLASADTPEFGPGS